MGKVKILLYEGREMEAGNKGQGEEPLYEGRER
jgi:hypothetical protein